MALLIALNGIMFTGVIVAITVSTATKALNKHINISANQEYYAQLYKKA